MHASLHTKFCKLVGVDVPIVQTGMGWVAGARLVSATANAGALGKSSNERRALLVSTCAQTLLILTNALIF